MFAPFVPKFGPWHASRGLVVCAYPCRYNLPLPVPFNAVRRIAFGRSLDDKVAQLPLPTFLPYGSKRDLERIAILEMKVEDARKPRDRSLYQTPAKRGERMNSEGNLRCTKCGVFKTISSFYLDSKNKYGHSCYCKLCQAEMRYYYSHTLRGIMKAFLSNAKLSAAKRSAIPGREDAGLFEIDVFFLLNLWLKQKGRCAYSNIVMNVEPWTPWKLSLERCDNTLGYVPGNVVFTCAEFNTGDNTVKAKYAVHGSSNWSREKVRSVPETIRSSPPLTDTEFNQIIERLRPARKENKYHTGRKVAENGDMLCPSCNIFLSVDNFYAQPRNSFGRWRVCKPCWSAYVWEYRNTFIGFLRSRLNSAKRIAKVRSNKGRGEAGDFDMTITDVLMLYKKQRGLCFYAGVKMSMRPNSNWMGSVERLDNTKGYVRGNVALICCEFQTSDQSFMAKAPVSGSAQWSKEKVSMLVLWLKSQETGSAR
eukprot:GEMP01039107.1.p1 GENE.GEMP01039107.1~~GEMP01039107.1.p1  ORF type:complete len:478 (+),score=15.11 GEMP01039107.1:247-1680(+)